MGHFTDSQQSEHNSITIGPGSISIEGYYVLTEETIKYNLGLSTKVMSSTDTESFTIISGLSHQHRVILSNTSGTKTVVLPSNPFDGETVEIIKITNGLAFTLKTKDAKSMQKCTGTIGTSFSISNNGKYTCIFSNSASCWYIMRDDFVTF